MNEKYTIVKPKFSLKYGGVPFSELDVKIKEEGYNTEYTLPDGIVIKTTCVIDEEAGVIWWTNNFSNPTNHNSRIVSELWDCDIDIPFDPDPVPCKKDRQLTWEPKTFCVYETNGANVTENDYIEIRNRLWENSDAFGSSCAAGRSGYVKEPYFDLNRQNYGALIAVGWTGQWHSLTKRNHDFVNFKSGIEVTNFTIYPGEHFRTASTAVLMYNNGRDEAHNRFRHFMRMISPLGGKGRGEDVPFSGIFWGGVPSTTLIQRWKDIKACGLPLDTCWIDAGWYEPLRAMDTQGQCASWMQTGMWEINKLYHPKQYLDVVEYFKANNIDFMVWFEPERYLPDLAKFGNYLTYKESDGKSELLALNEEETLQATIKLFGDLVEFMNLKVYRQDCNQAPLNFWRRNEAEDRRGMVEIHYINNLYRYWDALLERFPHLLIDNCAGGGHRNDLEMLSRSVPMWRSDYQCKWDANPEANQIQNQSSAAWFPYSGIGYGPTLGDLYSWRSAYTGGITVRTWEHVDPEWDVHPEEQNLAWAKKYFDEYVSVRHYFTRDFYPLVKISTENTSWQACQYHDPDDNSGIILAFRRAMCPSSHAEVQLHGFDDNKSYEFLNADTGEKSTYNGSKLNSEEFELYLKDKRSSGLWKYREI